MDASSPKSAFLNMLLQWAGMILLVLACWYVSLSALIGIQREKNIQRYLLVSEKMSDIQQYEERRGKMMDSRARLHFIATLRHQNEEAAFLLKELVRVAPKSVTFSFIQWQDKMILIKGYAHSDPEFVVFMDTIKKSSVLKHPMMTSGFNQNGSKHFELKMGLES